MREINYIVVHVSASPQGRGDDAQTIHRWHLENSWAGIGYHYVILEDGTIESGRPEYWKGSHVRGHNHESIGICLIGMGSDATEAQMITLKQLSDGLAFKYQAKVVGHSQLDGKKPDCPSIDTLERLLK